MIVAKQVVKDKFWLLHKQDEKIGIMTAGNGSISLELNNYKPVYFDTLDVACDEFNIHFDNKINYIIDKNNMNVHGYPVNVKPYNMYWDMNMKLPLFTTEPKSKCVYAAGYYKMIDLNEEVFCPKLIYLKRNEYEGPFINSSF